MTPNVLWVPTLICYLQPSYEVEGKVSFLNSTLKVRKPRFCEVQEGCSSWQVMGTGFSYTFYLSNYDYLSN